MFKDKRQKIGKKRKFWVSDRTNTGEKFCCSARIDKLAWGLTTLKLIYGNKDKQMGPLGQMCPGPDDIRNRYELTG